VNVKQAWLPPGAWENLAEDDVRLEPGDEYVLGFDGSWKNDCTAVVAIIKPRFEDDVYRVMRVASWEREMTDDDSWVVDKQLVVNTVMDFVRDNPGCIEIVADVSFWQDEAYQWAQAGLPVVEYPQSFESSCACYGEIVPGIMAGKIRHDGDGAIQRHVDNCILKMDSKGGSRLTEDYGNPRLKIDLAIALLMAYDRASGKLESPVPQSLRIGL
jgi:phage terminase large subunit-like protein